MNYLAHSFLSFSHEPILFGQFIADDIKGSRWREFPAAVQQGILLHRYIDDFTDNHPKVVELRKLLHPRLGKFSGVALDVLFDHVLCMRWEQYEETSHDVWIGTTYDLLAARGSEMSEKRKFILENMIKYNWMQMYATSEGVATILGQMSRRIPFENPLQLGITAFKEHKTAIISTFDEFFPEIISVTQAKLDTFAP
ncbi:MAG: ACP phosphodiesterase [Flavobacteriales bacterium]